MAYSRDGQGLHRAVDPADGEHYVYGHLFLDAAPRVFACFDQPDLKAPYAVTVRAPQDWLVLGNGAATQVSPGRVGARRDPAPGHLLRHRLRRALRLRARRARRHTAGHPRPRARLQGAPRARGAADARGDQGESFDYYHRSSGSATRSGSTTRSSSPSSTPARWRTPAA